jgi:hypothetical protein
LYRAKLILGGPLTIVPRARRYRGWVHMAYHSGTSSCPKGLAAVAYRLRKRFRIFRRAVRAPLIEPTETLATLRTDYTPFINKQVV